MFKSHARVCLVTTFAIFLACSKSAVADDEIETLDTFFVSTVSGLYGAVYDENGLPRDNADIILDMGNYVLDPTALFEGRLVLGDNTTLRSTLDMEEGPNGSPMVELNNDPVVLVEGATIDGSALPPAPFGEGVIVVGNQGAVENLRVVGGFRPGIEITSQGTIREVFSADHSLGFRIRAEAEAVEGSIKKSLATRNLFGISCIAFEPDLAHPTGANVDVRANIVNNTLTNNGITNLFVNGGVGSNHNHIRVIASRNVIGGAFFNIRVGGGFNFGTHGGSDNNKVELTLTDNNIADGTVGLRIEGGTLNFFAPPLDERLSSDNKASVILSKNTFDDNDTDIVLYGSVSSTGEAGGDRNKAEAIIKGMKKGLVIDTFDCFPAADFPSCTSKANIKFGPAKDRD
jgi:hypothetical protein